MRKSQEGLTDAEMIVKLLHKVDHVMEVVSGSSQSASPMGDEKDIEQNLSDSGPEKLMPQQQIKEAERQVPEQLMQQPLQIREAERQAETMKVRAVEAEKL